MKRKHTLGKLSALAGISFGLALASAGASVITFEGILTEPESYRNDAGGGGFVIQGATFANEYIASWDSWSGFAISNTTDTTTPGYLNQYSAYPGIGVGGSSSYAVSYVPATTSIALAEAQDLNGKGTYVTNTTYAALSMQNGDSFAKAFGGATGDDEDFFLLTITGLFEGVATGSIEFYLADYRFADNSLDFIVDQWEYVDLSPLGVVDELSFELLSSDNGAFGMNTPAYFALDHFLIPEPSASLLAAVSLGGVLLRRRRFQA